MHKTSRVAHADSLLTIRAQRIGSELRASPEEARLCRANLGLRASSYRWEEPLKDVPAHMDFLAGRDYAQWVKPAGQTVTGSEGKTTL